MKTRDVVSPASLEAADPLALIALFMSLPGIRPGHYWRLVARIGDLTALWSWPLADLLTALPAQSAGAFACVYRGRQQSPRWRQFHDRLTSLGNEVALLSHRCCGYPGLLLQIADPPPLLYLRGAVDCLGAPQLAMVGSRKASGYGVQAAQRLAGDLAASGMAITSGLAIGVDAAAHRGALAVEGKTLAVLGTGIDQTYPRRHRKLAAQIVDGGGLLLTEFAPDSELFASNFPQRNRIVSGLSLGVLVVEAELKSGSLITARHAMEQGREVFALPGSINSPLSRGCHQLLRDGATLVENSADIGRELWHWLPAERPHSAAAGTSPTTTSPATTSPATTSPSTTSPSTTSPDTSTAAPEPRALWKLLDHEPRHLEELLPQVDLATAEVLAALTRWELEGLIRRDHEHYCRNA